MKANITFGLLILATAALFAHDHIEVGIDPVESGQLGIYGPAYQIALLVPVGEPFSNYAPDFPGGYYANELTFTSETNVLEPAMGADLVIEILSVAGPQGGVFSFWEANVVTPTWSRPTGWTPSPPAVPAEIRTDIGGNNHIHGRAFTANTPGTYTISYRARDASGTYLSSNSATLTVEALPTPPLQIQAQGGNAVLTFKSRLNLNYDLQSSTTLAPGSWTTLDGLQPIEGDGSDVQVQDPLGGRPRVFYRLVEYR